MFRDCWIFNTKNIVMSNRPDRGKNHPCNQLHLAEHDNEYITHVQDVWTWQSLPTLLDLNFQVLQITAVPIELIRLVIDFTYEEVPNIFLPSGERQSTLYYDAHKINFDSVNRKSPVLPAAHRVAFRGARHKD